MKFFLASGFSQKQIGFPVIVRIMYRILDEGEVMGPARVFDQGHPGLFQAAVGLFIVAYCAGAHQIVPGVISPQALGHQVVDGKRPLAGAAVLADVAIPPENILFGKLDLQTGSADETAQPDDAGQYESSANAGGKIIAILDHFRFSQEQQNQGPLGITDQQRFIILVEHQHLAPQIVIYTYLTSGCDSLWLKLILWV